jgi:hypothetical protein
VALFPFACPPGTYGGSLEAAHQALPLCEAICPAGYYCEVAEVGVETSGGPVGPVMCPRGNYCPLGAARPTPCPAGSYGDDINQIDHGNWIQNLGYSRLTSPLDCKECPGGHRCAEGAYALLSTGAPLFRGPAGGHRCPEGAFARNGSDTCTSCAPGEYQALSGRTACDECPAGAFCVAHTSVPVPCFAGTWTNGSAWACEPCPGGAYQPSEGQSSCLACAADGWCPERSTEVRECSGGRRANLTVAARNRTSYEVGRRAAPRRPALRRRTLASSPHPTHTPPHHATIYNPVCPTLEPPERHCHVQSRRALRTPRSLPPLGSARGREHARRMPPPHRATPAPPHPTARPDFALRR